MVALDQLSGSLARYFQATELTTVTLDLGDTANRSTLVDVSNYSLVSFVVQVTTGTLDTAQIDINGSLDGVYWPGMLTVGRITEERCYSDILVSGFKFIRFETAVVNLVLPAVATITVMGYSPMRPAWASIQPLDTGSVVLTSTSEFVWNVTGGDTFAVQTDVASGSWGTGVITLERSLTGSTYVDMGPVPLTITGPTMVTTGLGLARWVRARVSTTQVGACTVTLTAILKVL